MQLTFGKRLALFKKLCFQNMNILAPLTIEELLKKYLKKRISDNKPIKLSTNRFILAKGIK